MLHGNPLRVRLFAALALAALAAVAGAYALSVRGRGGETAHPSRRAGDLVIRSIERDRSALPGTLPDGTPYDATILVHGEGFFGTSFGPFVRFDGRDAAAVVLESDRRLRVLAPPGLPAEVEVEVENPDRARAAVKAKID